MYDLCTFLQGEENNNLKGWDKWEGHVDISTSPSSCNS